jgi:eukaryotic-like serine/threonine-protein kinase
VIAMLGLAAAALGWLAWSNRPPARTVFIVESNPVGAEVYVDDNMVGVTPLHTKIVRDGRDHDIELRKVGYWPTRQRARADGEAQNLSTTLQPARASLKVRSKPARAHVSVDGATACETPCTVENLETRRKHSVRVSLEGYSPVEREIDMPPAGAPPIDATLVQLPPAEKVAGANKVVASAQVAARAPSALGTVRRVEGEAPISPRVASKAAGDVVLKSDPWARIIVDGKDTGRTTSAASFKLPVGKHEITLVNPPLKLKKTLTIVVKADEATKKFISLR